MNVATDRPPADPVLAAGELIAHRYLIRRFIDRGGMGDVYEAEDVHLQQPVALKMVRADQAVDPRAIGRFKQEILLARRVTHRNVCRVFDMGYHAAGTGPRMFLTMELVVGPTLEDHLRGVGRLPPREALPVVEQLAAALDAAHQAGVIHRDIKCQNIILDGDRVVVTDFGIARASSEWQGGRAWATGTGAMVGSPEYLAPEQVVGDPVTFASDIYGLGVVMFEMVTGRLPFVAETPLAAAARRLVERPPAPRTIVTDLPLRWQSVILRCLERQPADRFSRARDVVQALTGRRPCLAETSARR